MDETKQHHHRELQLLTRFPKLSERIRELEDQLSQKDVQINVLKHLVQEALPYIFEIKGEEHYTVLSLRGRMKIALRPPG